jgi:hypothetical protein
VGGGSLLRDEDHRFGYLILRAIGGAGEGVFVMQWLSQV